jgi:hypothetical protein
MPLVQILVTAALNGTNFDVPIYGMCNITVVSVQYHTTENAAGNHRVIQLQSDKLRFINSPLQFLTFGSYFSANIAFNQGFVPSIKNAQLDGKINLRAVDIATGALPANMTHCLITLDIEECR